jgi:hypothetical protein
MTKYVEKELVHLDGETVILIRPIVGTQSDAWRGKFTVIQDGGGAYTYEVCAGHKDTLFTMSDVVRVENPGSHIVGVDRIIRLKGPKDY